MNVKHAAACFLARLHQEILQFTLDNRVRTWRSYLPLACPDLDNGTFPEYCYCASLSVLSPLDSHSTLHLL
jgi:hypothetical protein